MDGNRRWAKAQGISTFRGHQAGFERSKEIIQESLRLDIEVVTLWGFSTENWKRSKREVDYLMRLFERYIISSVDTLHKKGIRIRHIGRKDRLPKYLMKLLQDAEKLTGKNSKMILQLALDYGGRDEILRALQKWKKPASILTEEAFSLLLDTADVLDPDLIVRTSGEIRLSGFLPWQGVYSELYFTRTPFPAFTVSQFHKALREYQRRKRNFGS